MGVNEARSCRVDALLIAAIGVTLAGAPLGWRWLAPLWGDIGWHPFGVTGGRGARQLAHGRGDEP